MKKKKLNLAGLKVSSFITGANSLGGASSLISDFCGPTYFTDDLCNDD